MKLPEVIKAFDRQGLRDQNEKNIDVAEIVMTILPLYESAQTLSESSLMKTTFRRATPTHGAPEVTTTCHRHVSDLHSQHLRSV